MRDVYKNIGEYNVDKDRKISIVFDDMIADIKNKKLNLVVTELFIRGRKLNISLVFITQSYFKVPKMLDRILLTFLLQKLQQIAINHSADISTKYCINIRRKCNFEPYSFLVNNTTLVSDNPLRFRKKFFG